MNDSSSNSVREKRHTSLFPLALAGSGESVRIVVIRGAGTKERLLSMGIHVNDIIEVIASRKMGSVMVANEMSRFMLGGGMSRKILVTKE